MKIEYGDEFKKKQTEDGKVITCYVVDESPEDNYIIKLAYKLPYQAGQDPHRFVHIEKLKKNWHNMRKGVQLKMFR